MLQKLGSELSIFNFCDAHFAVGKIIYWVDNFGQWATLIFLDAQMTTQLRGSVNQIIQACLSFQLNKSCQRPVYTALIPINF